MKKTIAAAGAVMALMLTTACDFESRPLYKATITGEGSADIKLTVDGKVVVQDQRKLPFSYPTSEGARTVKLSAISVEDNPISCTITAGSGSEEQILSQKLGSEVNCQVGR